MIHRAMRIRWLSILALAAMLLLGLVSSASAQERAVIPDTNVGRWSFLIGTFLPLAIAAVNRQRWTSQAKGLMTFMISTAAAAGTSYFTGDFSGEDLVTSFLIVLVSATVTYTVFWKPSGIAPAVESATG